MADVIKLKVDSRKITGKKVKQLRAKGILPANIYGKGVKSLSISLTLKDFNQIYKQAGETNIINIQVDKDAKLRPVLIHNIHLHPVTDEFLHVDFHQVDLTKKVSVAVPIEIIGESPAVSTGGVLVQLLNEIEVEALPADLPDKFTIDASKLATIGAGVSLKDLKVSDKVKIMVENLDELVVKIEEPTKEEEKPAEVAPTTPAVAEGEGPAETAKPTEETKPEDKKEPKPTPEKK